MWHLILLDVKSIINESIRRPLLHLLLIPILLGHQSPFSITFPIMNFTELLFQHVLINVEDVVSQTISVKTAQNFKSTNQFRLKKLNLSLTISFSVQILRHNISAAVIIIIS